MSGPIYYNEPLYDYLSNGSTIDAKGNYSSTAEDFQYTCPVGKQASIERMLVTVRDAGSFDSGRYGNNIVLSKGIQLMHKDAAGGVLYAPMGVNPIKVNIDWGSYCFDVELHKFGLGDEFLLARWTFAKAGIPMILKAGESLAVRLNDDFSGLEGHKFHIQGKLGNTY